MNDYELLNIIGKAFADGEIEHLRPLLADDCKYKSDYSGKEIVSSDKIIESMKKVNNAVIENNEIDRYSFRIVSVEESLKEGQIFQKESGDDSHLNDLGLLLFQYSETQPVAFVSIEQKDESGLISRILLSRDSSVYDVQFYGEVDEEDSPQDLPSTVESLSAHEIQRRELGSHFSWQQLDDNKCEDGLYIWRKADEYFQKWLDFNGYRLIESRTFEDCIGYRCIRKHLPCTLYMFAYGKKRTTQLDGDFCSKLLKYDFTEGEVLVVYLNVKKKAEGNTIKYEVGRYDDADEKEINPWRVKCVMGKYMLEYYPRKEMNDALYKLMYAFNHDNLDVYDAIIVKDNPSILGIDKPGMFLNSAFYGFLHNLHVEYGDMKIGYVRYNDVIYSSVPYLDGYGFFGFKVDSDTDRIYDVTAFPFEGGERKIEEFIKTNEREPEDMYDVIPQLIGVNALPPVETERFALTLTYDNGECRKYVLPIPSDNENDEVVNYDRHVFSDGIWQSAEIHQQWPSEMKNYSYRRPVVVFKNGYVLSGIETYYEGTEYSEPEICGEVIYENDELQVKREWKWNVNSIYKDDETGLLKVLIRGEAFNWGGISTLASIEGKRNCSLDFVYMSSFIEGLALVAKEGEGYGFIDKNMHFVVSMKYERADDFCDGKAKVMKDGEWIIIDKEGNEIIPERETAEDKYEEVGDFCEGMCKVSTLRLGLMDLAYHSDYSSIAGKWGFINEKGEEVITPQYIYATDFEDGIAFVCKGEWTIDKKWDNEYNTGRYWTDEELWGAIDKEGNEVIPLVFDEIKRFFDTNDAYMAHFGGWENGSWGVIDNRGNWLVEPGFEQIGYEYHDGMFTFYNSSRWDDETMGIYDINQQRVLFEPQFEDVSFLDDGWICVEVYDKEKDRIIEKLIDRDGNEKFHSEYSSIYTWKTPYEVVIRDENGDKHGLIDKDGTVILPCEYDAEWNGIHYEQRRIVFNENSKQGCKDFDGNIIIPPDYYELRSVDKPLIIVRTDSEGDYQGDQYITRNGKDIYFCEGVVTQNNEKVIPAVFQNIRWINDEYFVCCRTGLSEMYRLIRKGV